MKGTLGIRMQKKFLDFVRLTITSPELLAALLVLLLIQLVPQIPEMILAVVDISDGKIKLSILGIPLIMTIGAYKICSEILNPTEHKSVLYGWPEFWLLRNRIQATLGIAALSSLISWIGVGLTAIGNKPLGVTVVAASCAALAISVIHAVLAKMALTEILNTPPERLQK